MHMGGLGIYDQSTVPGGRLRCKEILERVERQLHLSSVFRCKLANVALSTRRDVMPDPDVYAACLQASYDALDRVSRPARPPRGSRSRSNSARQRSGSPSSGTVIEMRVATSP